MNANENNHICKTCKYWGLRYDNDYHCSVTCKITDEQDTCDNWTDPVVVEPTEEEKRANAGCDEAHRRMVEGRER